MKKKKIVKKAKKRAQEKLVLSRPESLRDVEMH